MAAVKGGSAAEGSTTGNSRPKVLLFAHMNDKEKINFKMYRDDKFEKVMWVGVIKTKGGSEGRGLLVIASIMTVTD